jgi:hypothetical protein
MTAENTKAPVAADAVAEENPSTRTEEFTDMMTQPDDESQHTRKAPAGLALFLFGTPDQIRDAAWAMLLLAAERERLASDTPWPEVVQRDGYREIDVACEWWPAMNIVRYGDDAHPHPWVIEDSADGSTWDESSEAKQTVAELATVVNLAMQLNKREGLKTGGAA